MTLPACAGSSIGAEDIPRMPFLTACINEALRLYPSVPDFGRAAVCDDVIAGFKVGVGSTVRANIYALHRCVVAAHQQAILANCEQQFKMTMQS